MVAKRNNVELYESVEMTVLHIFGFNRGKAQWKRTVKELYPGSLNVKLDIANVFLVVHKIDVLTLG